MIVTSGKVLIGLVLVACSVVGSTFNNSERTEWERSSFYYGILSQAAHYGGSDNSTCIAEIKDILKGLEQKELWALKTYDASGGTQTNFVYGAIFWLGSEFSCDNLNRQLEMAVSDNLFVELKTSVAPFKLKYAIAYANYTASNTQLAQASNFFVPIHIGLCLPESCTIEEIYQMSQRYFSGDTLSFKETYNLTMDVIEVKKTSFRDFIVRVDVITILSILAIFILIVVVINIIPVKNMPDGSIVKRIAKCFNLKQNYKNIFSIETSSEAVIPIDAAKTIVCFFIMILHMAQYSLFASRNQSIVFFYGYDIRFLILFLAGLYVDVFFVTSTFLLCYHFLRNEKQKKDIQANGIVQNLKLYLKVALNRYIRLTPALMVSIALGHLAAAYIKHTLPVNMPEEGDLFCSIKSFLATIAYIHSYFGLLSLCGSVNWYLASEMQYYLVCLLGLFIYVKSPRAGKSFFISLCIASLIYSYVQNAQEDFQLTHDAATRTVNTLYINPLVRMNPVFPGVFGAYYLYKIKNTPIKLKNSTVYTWAIVSISSWIALLSGYKYLKYFPSFVWYSSNSIGRFCFGIMTVQTILITHMGRGGSFGKFMRHKCFSHFTKLTYSMYLLYPIVATLYIAEREVPYTLTFSSVYIDGFGTILVCYIVSIVASLFFEVPYCKLSSEFLLKKKKKIQVESDSTVGSAL